LSFIASAISARREHGGYALPDLLAEHEHASRARECAARIRREAHIRLHGVFERTAVRHHGVGHAGRFTHALRDD
jgi:hypothetical protein